MLKILRILLAMCASIFGASTAIASELVFRGQNAALFPDANPADTTAMMNSVHKPAAKATTIPTLSPATLIEQSVISQISSKIYDDIFHSENASGSFDLGDGNHISYLRAGGYVTITITNPTSGTTTLTVPDI